jgi:hypothetical protein
MSTSNYVVDSANKIAIRAGRQSFADFQDEVDTYKDFMDTKETITEYSIDETPIKDITVQDGNRLYEAFNILQQMSWVRSTLMSLDYWWRNDGLTYVHESELPKGYKTIE